MIFDGWHAVEDRGAWWVEDGHGDTRGGPFGSPIIANEWLDGMKRDAATCRARVEQETAERMRRPIEADFYRKD